MPPLLIVLILLSQAALAECEGPNGPVDCASRPDLLDKANSSGARRKHIDCRIHVMTEVLTQAERCGKLQNREACRANGADCTWTRSGRCGGYYLEDCKLQAASSRFLCSETSWSADKPKCDGAGGATAVDCFVCEPHPSNALRRTHKGR